MEDDGTYEEALPCGGKFRVTTTSWEIRYYFPGPDRRYTGTNVTLPGFMLQEYIDAYLENWEAYQKLKDALPLGGSFSKLGKGYMQIRVGGYAEGVCIRDHHNPVNERNALEKIISGYEYAIDRAPKIQSVLASVSEVKNQS